MPETVEPGLKETPTNSNWLVPLGTMTFVRVIVVPPVPLVAVLVESTDMVPMLLPISMLL